MVVAKQQSPVLWLQVWGLAFVQGAIALMWVIYNLYLQKLLVEFGFPAALATSLLIVEGILAGVTEPLMGSFSDRTQHWVGSRFPLISFGVILASASFVAIPAIVIFGGNLTGTLRWILPIVVVAWAFAMTIFRSPALSLLGRYAFGTQLPQAASILTLVGAVAGAMAPLANQFILQLGAGLTFTIGSVVLLGAAAVLRSVHPPDLPVQPDASGSIPEMQSMVSIPILGLVFGAGAGVAVGFRLMMQTFPQVLQTQVMQANTGLILGLIFIAIAVTAIPSGTLAVRIGNRRAMVIGLSAMAICLVILPFTHSAVVASILAIALGSAFSLVSNGTIPLALSLVPPSRAGLGTGIYFGGGAIGSSLFLSLFNNIALTASALVAAGAFLLAGVCVALTRRS